MFWFRKKLNSIHIFNNAFQWINKYTVENKGISISSLNKNSYPEVTGYYIPTLLKWGERELAVKFANWLVSIQNSDGSWSDPDGKESYTFDTGQILKGLMALVDNIPEFKGNILKGCDWILKQQKESGQITTPDTSFWKLPKDKIVPEAIHLYVLEPVRDAAIKWGIDKYDHAVNKAINYYTKDSKLTDFNTLSHFHAYVIEALVDLGCTEIARKAMEATAKIQKSNGAVPGYNDVSWVCSTGLFQYALIWYKLGEVEKADKAFAYACRLQNKSGGFYGSYGWNSNYFPRAEISWAIKYFLDAYYWKIKSMFNIEISIFPDTIDENDGRVRRVREFFGDMNGKKVIDVGCGKGRFLKVYKELFPNGDFFALDLSEEMLKHCPPGVKKDLGSILNIPYPDNYFDCVYSVETLEHSISVVSAIRELCRVLKPGGKIIVIDKDKKKLGKLRIEDWEQWFKPEQVIQLLAKQGVNSSYVLLSNKEYNLIDKLFVAWEGIKNK